MTLHIEYRPRSDNTLYSAINALNNFAQSRHLTVSYTDTHTGTQHAGVWISIVYSELEIAYMRYRSLISCLAVNGVEHGRATGSNRNAARAGAAQIALNVLELV